MREIKFRALPVFNGRIGSDKEFIRSGFIYQKKNSLIIGGVKCQPETLGQYTGLKDRSDTEIYEGDILLSEKGVIIEQWYGGQKAGLGEMLKVVRLASGFSLVPVKKETHNLSPNTVGVVTNYNFWNHARSLEIVGNIHQNPELIS